MVAPDLVNGEDIAKLIIPDDLPGDSTLNAYIEVKIYDKERHVIQYRRQPMRSPTWSFLALMVVPLLGTYQSPSTNQAIGALANPLGLPSQATTYNNGSAGIAWDFSIQLGSGTQAFSPKLTSLAAPIANGTGAGQLSYGSLLVTYSGASIYLYITVINYSSTTINVTEIGINATVYLSRYSQYNYNTFSPYNSLLTYDRLSPPVTLPPGTVATFKITLSFSG